MRPASKAWLTPKSGCCEPMKRREGAESRVLWEESKVFLVATKIVNGKEKNETKMRVKLMD